MQYDAGIDVSLEQSSVCVVDAAGKITKEAKIASDPCVLATFFKGLGFPVTRIGFEAGPLSHWLYAGLTQAGFDVVLLETRQFVYRRNENDERRRMKPLSRGPVAGTVGIGEASRR